jgi:hypothetical protein
MSLNNRLAALEALAQANELKIKALAAKNQELQAQNAEIQNSIQSFDPENDFTYYALSLGALSNPQQGGKVDKNEKPIGDLSALLAETAITEPTRQVTASRDGEDESDGTVWEEMDLRTPPSPLLPTPAPQRAAPALSKRSQPLGLGPAQTCRDALRRPGPAPRSLPFAIPSTNGDVVEFPIRTLDLAFILRETLIREGLRHAEIEVIVKVCCAPS